MRDVNYGWLMRYTHMVGASLFFLAVYIHIFRGLYYGSYKAPREVLWMIGVAILIVHDRDGVHGLLAGLGSDELLGRDGYHEPVLLVQLDSFRVSAPTLVQWIWGGFSVDNRDAQPSLQPPLSAALRHCGARRASTSGLCMCRAATTRSASKSAIRRRKRFLSIRTSRRRTCLPWPFRHAFRLCRVLGAELPWRRGELCAGQSRW